MFIIPLGFHYLKLVIIKRPKTGNQYFMQGIHVIITIRVPLPKTGNYKENKKKVIRIHKTKTGNYKIKNQSLFITKKLVIIN